MRPLVALAYYPLWAVAVTVALTALRLGRNVGRGLVALCFFLALWVTGLILLETEATAALAERVLPGGIVVAAGLVHAHADVVRTPRHQVAVAYAASAAIALLGAVSPRLLYGPAARSPGPLFFPLAAVLVLAVVVLGVGLARSTLAARGVARRRLAALFFGSVLATLGGGFVVALRVLGLGDVLLAAPLLLPAILLVAYAVLLGERGRSRRVVTQGLSYAVLTALLTSLGLVAFFKSLPWLAPGGGASLGWLAYVVFLAALPSDPLRMLVVEHLGRRLFARPIGVRDLAEEIERVEERADQAERLAELGRLSSAVAHEIRNPLGVIAAQTKLLERQGARPETVASLRAQVDRARRFLDDLLRYSRPRPLEVSEVDVLSTLRLAASHVRQIVGEGAPSIDLAPGPAAPIFVEADRGAFLDVATALLQNAAIALDGAAGGRIRVVAERGEGVVVVRVEDNGPGVPPEIEATLFQPFVTGRGRDAKHPGTGLGLAVAARWLERHGGSLRHERAPGGGARFEARWPDSKAGSSPVGLAGLSR
ncbi:histidine kinase [Sorangium cellulosum]|uniref:histidine kinase n=1 Tax=Sorangium cellulosum TaxID=56 RepID=A0A4P2QA64_SORCE|nr:HAMP domain-containing sensor histidine kinase [Sorangium cellulosum]AUX26505.1 histidine kinase [Sorangium cellulosum]